MPYRGFKKKPPPVKMAWVVAMILLLLCVGAVGYALCWAVNTLVMTLL